MFFIFFRKFNIMGPPQKRADAARFFSIIFKLNSCEHRNKTAPEQEFSVTSNGVWQNLAAVSLVLRFA